MGFNCGIVGMPNVGKSTLFNAITAAGVSAENYPFCTVDPNVGLVHVPDPRIDDLVRIYRPGRATPATIGFVDIAGLVRGASRGEGLGNQFLSHIREVDAICHVVRCFEDENVAHVDGSVDPGRDIAIIETELLLKDVETVGRRLAEAGKRGKGGDKHILAEAEYCERLLAHLGEGRPAVRLQPGTPDEETWMRELHLLTAKPVVYVANVDEEHLTSGNGLVATVRDIAAKEGSRVVVACAKLEAEIASMPYGEREQFLRDLGIQSSGLDQLIHEGYALLDLITFFTCNPNEVRAWTVRRGATALRAAGKVHSDMERGFIRAEVIRHADLVAGGSEHAVRERGLLAVHGREYVVGDGDIIFVRFAV